MQGSVYLGSNLLSKNTYTEKPVEAEGCEREEKVKALKEQVGGTHYKNMPIQPIEFIMANNLPFIEGSIVKYVCRWKQKGGKEDLEKVIHYATILLEQQKT